MEAAAAKDKPGLTGDAGRGTATPLPSSQTGPPAAAQTAVEWRDALVLELGVQVLVPHGQVSEGKGWLLGRGAL